MRILHMKKKVCLHDGYNPLRSASVVSQEEPHMAARSVHSIVASTLLILTCLVLGLLAGGMLVIGIALVSFWKSLSPSDFQAWFAAYGHLVGRLMIPLGVGALAVAGATVVACWRGAATARRWLLIAAVGGEGG